MLKDLKEIPFTQGATSTLLPAICALFMFLTFLSYSFYHLFSPNGALVEAEQAPGYVIVLPDANPADSTANPSADPTANPQGKALAQQDAMGFLDHMLSYLDDVIAHKEFVMKDYSSILPLFMADSAKVPYVEIRLARQAHLNDLQFRQDLEGIIPGVKIYTRNAFFSTWISKLESVAAASRSIALMMFVALCAAVVILISGCFKMHQETIQTLRFLGASQKYITQKFQSFFSKRFLIGNAIGLVIALFVFTPFAWILDPTLKMGALLSQSMAQLILMGTLGYTLLFAIMRTLLSVHAKKLA